MIHLKIAAIKIIKKIIVVAISITELFQSLITALIISTLTHIRIPAKAFLTMAKSAKF